MNTFVKLLASFVIVILFILLNSYMSMELGRVTGAGMFGLIFLVVGLGAIWRYKPKSDTDKVKADEETLNKK